MKRMVKNGDLLDVKPNGDLGIAGNAQVDGRLQVDSSIIANGEIRGGNISGAKFLLGTEEMPLVKANPTGEATETLEKIGIGDVAYKVGGGAGDRELTLKVSFNRDSNPKPNIPKIQVEEDIWNNINNFYYDIIKLQYADGSPMAIFTAMYLSRYEFGEYDVNSKAYTALAYNDIVYEEIRQDWYGYYTDTNFIVSIETKSDSNGKYVTVKTPYSRTIPTLQQDKFDALYKLADKPTQDGTYVLKATVSGGAVTYTWVAQ